jgi:hypothetical protein
MVPGDFMRLLEKGRIELLNKLPVSKRRIQSPDTM